MPKGYLVANVRITDPARYEEYRSQVGPMVQRFGGRFLVRGGTMEKREHAEGWHRVVVLEFPSLDAARRFYESPDYAPLIALRNAATESQLVLVEGTDPS